MARHDSWVYLVSPSPYDEITVLFPLGFPVRDPYPAATTQRPVYPLWVVDPDRLNSNQIRALAAVVAVNKKLDIEIVLAGYQREGICIRHKWVKNLFGGAECYQRTLELMAFLDSGNKDLGSFLEQQRKDWIEGNKTPLPLPGGIKDFDSRFVTPELEEFIEARNFFIESNFYSFFATDCDDDES